MKSMLSLGFLVCLLPVSAISNPRQMPGKEGWSYIKGTMEMKLAYYRHLPTHSHEVTLLGMKLKRIDSLARVKYGFDHFDGVYISELGEDWVGMGGRNLSVGSKVSAIYDMSEGSSINALFPVMVAANILNALKPRKGATDLFSCQMITSKPKATVAARDQVHTLEFNSSRLARLKEVLRPVTFSGVTFSSVSDSLSKLYNLDFLASVVVTKVAPETENHGFSGLQTGIWIAFVGGPGLAQGVMSPIDLAQVMIKHAVKGPSGKYEYTLDAWAESKPYSYKVELSDQQLEALIRIVTNQP